MPLSNRAPVNAAGQIMVTGTTPTPAWPVLGGMTYDPVTGELAVTSAVPNATDPWVGGLRFTNLGALYIVTTIPSPVFYVGGLPVSTLGQLFMSANPPVGSVGGWPIAGDGGVAGIGSGIGPVPIFWAPLLTTLVPLLAGNPTFTFTRATTAYVADQDGILRQAPSGGARFQGARMVRNLFTATAVLSTQTPTVIAGQHVISFTGTGTITYSGAAAGSLVGQGASVRVGTLPFTTTAGGLVCTVTGSVTLAQLEFVGGQSNQAPAEYVSVGTLVAPYQGAGIDGLAFFATTNANTLT